jgi:hypothetical protein
MLNEFLGFFMGGAEAFTDHFGGYDSHCGVPCVGWVVVSLEEGKGVGGGRLGVGWEVGLCKILKGYLLQDLMCKV